MLDPARGQGPLAPLHLAARATRDFAGAAVFLGERRILGQINVRLGAADTEAAAAAADAIGAALPDAPNTVSEGPQSTVLWLGPDEWLVASTAGADANLQRNLDVALAAHHAAITDVSDLRAVIVLGGPRARDVLAKGCSLDFHPRVFGSGRCAQTQLARASVIIHQRATDPLFDIYVERSYAEYLWLWLEDAALEFAVVVADLEGADLEGSG
ncbi:MAG TPA: sarcosine oxidase subunit gamma family protein [Alphaproteobacteria bacterium]|nr:sarcosine oxidase subunit gamma family protein [Alphaproteobacteria bacterium]